MKWLAGILCVITLLVWGGVLWTLAGNKAADSDPATYHVSIDNEMTQKVRVNNYFHFVPIVKLIEEKSVEMQDNVIENNRNSSDERGLENYIGQVNPDESISIDTLLAELGIDTVAAR
ncbi:hypothetical protein F9U64_05595 [Gracilibacillus oryzae]|uniref:Uncharacterized protein n=1 Tax=Gracilibacillus oryzae TaxID=1672701 RepID=A0A7C8KTS1_9BACI|nr:hypothetical protein [Gracilibacillus oryzae]KAB8138304.1 hypothetical protein F9U64_05595 [Gracilibacillus oryzae]